MSAPAKISIVTGGPLCRNPRALKEARTLGAAGYEVTVFTLAHRAAYEQLDAELLAQAPFRKVPLQIAPAAGQPNLRSFTARAATWLARRLARYGINSDCALGPVPWFTHLVRQSDADLTIVHTEVGLAVGRRLRRIGRRVAADLEDWHSRDLLPEAQQSRPRKLLQRLEREMLHHSPFTLTTSEALADALTATYGGGRPVVVRNTFPLQPLHPRAAGNPRTFFWFSQTLGPGRGVEEFIAAWDLMSVPSRLCLVGQPVPGYDESLVGRVSPPRRTSLEFQAPVSPTGLPGLIARHDIGLALEPSEPANKDLTISNKVFQYLNAGLAVLATTTAGQREAAAEAGGGILLIRLDDPRALARTLDELARDDARIHAMRTAARQAAEHRFCWEKEEPTLLAVVARALNRSPNGSRG